MADKSVSSPKEPESEQAARSHEAIASAMSKADRGMPGADEKLEAILRASADGIFMVDRDRHVLVWNPGMERITGHRFAEVRGADVLSLFPFTISDAEHTALNRALDGHRVVAKARKLVVPTTRQRGFFETSYWPLEARDGRSGGVLGIVRDVSQGKELEERLLHVQKMDVAGRLATGIAHDFNNLLTVILGEVSLAETSTERYAGALGEIRRSAERAAALTRQLLTFSRREAREHEVVSVAELLLDMEQMLRRLLGEDIELRTRFSENAGCIRGDRTRIEQVFANLASNARDAMPSGGRLEVAAERVSVAEEPTRLTPGDYVQILFRDTGIGISDDVKARLFEPFFTTKEPGSGTGLGLATSYDIVQQSGGHIVVDSELGCGTTVRVYLPRTQCVRRAAPPAELETVPQGDETILIVEDDERVRAITARVLRAHGFVALEAGDAATALSVTKNHRGTVDLLLTDLVLPGTGGPELAREIQRYYPDARVLFVSGYGEAHRTHRRSVADGDPFLHKPYAPNVLVHRVRQVLDLPPVTEQGPER